jgi:DNA polymerase-3 subunit gamma/tau
MLQAIGELEPRFRKSGQQQLLVETLLVRFALLDKSVALEDLLRSMGGEGRIGEALPQPRRDSPTGAERSGGGESGSGGGGAPGPFARPEPRPAARADGSGARAEAVAQPSAQASRQATVQLSQPAPIAASGVEPLDLNKLTGRWDALVERMRGGGKPMLATALEHSSPVAVNASGVITIELDEANDIYARAIGNARAEIVEVLREWFAGVERLELRRDELAPSAPPKRLTDEMVRAERIAALKKRDPVLSAAIEALDLEVAD